MIQKKKPGFQLQYDFDNGSLPPPWHYEYRIQIKPQGTGLIRFLPDYPSSSTPCWEEKFQVKVEKLEELWDLLVKKEILRDQWPLQEEALTGGEWQRLEVTLGEKTFAVPSSIEHRTAEEINEVFVFVRGLVPQPIWQQLEDRRRFYEENAEKN